MIHATSFCAPTDGSLFQIPGFERDPLLVTKHAVSQEAGVVDAYKHVSPVVDTDVYVPWLQHLVSTLR